MASLCTTIYGQQLPAPDTPRLFFHLASVHVGASNPIVSLWMVSDYEELGRGGNKARALRAAQLATMKKHPHPKDWAGFVLVGQSR